MNLFLSDFRGIIYAIEITSMRAIQSLTKPLNYDPLFSLFWLIVRAKTIIFLLMQSVHKRIQNYIIM